MKIKIFNWVDRNKDTDTILINFLKLMYSLSFDWLKPIIDIAASVYLSYYLNPINYLAITIIIIILFLANVWYSYVNSYKNHEYKIRRNAGAVLNEISLIMTTLDDYINGESSNDGKGIFEYASDLISCSMYDVLKEITGCEIRISVIQQFHEYNTKRKCTMISRRSKKRKSCSKDIKLVKYIDKKDYYYLKILFDNKETYIYLDEDDINEKFCTGSRRQEQKIFQYIGIPEKVKSDSDIAFLLQIDGMGKNTFGKSKCEFEDFVNNYIFPYTNFLKHAYNIERKITEINRR